MVHVKAKAKQKPRKKRPSWLSPLDGAESDGTGSSRYSSGTGVSGACTHTLCRCCAVPFKAISGMRYVYHHLALYDTH